MNYKTLIFNKLTNSLAISTNRGFDLSKDVEWPCILNASQANLSRID